jgi:hypothetical protein
MKLSRVNFQLQKKSIANIQNQKLTVNSSQKAKLRRMTHHHMLILKLT